MLIVGALVLIAGLIKMSFKNEYSGYMKGMLKLLDVIFNLALKPIADVIGMFLLPVLKLLLPILIKMNKKAGKILGDIKMPENFENYFFCSIIVQCFPVDTCGTFSDSCFKMYPLRSFYSVSFIWWYN